MPSAIAAIVLAACLLAALFGALAAASTAEAKKAGKKKARVTRFDRDGDGIRNGRDRNVDGDRKRNVVDTDVDGDGRRNDYDHDIDADGVQNAFDADSDASGEQFRASAATAPGASRLRRARLRRRVLGHRRRPESRGHDGGDRRYWGARAAPVVLLVDDRAAARAVRLLAVRRLRGVRRAGEPQHPPDPLRPAGVPLGAAGERRAARHLSARQLHRLRRVRRRAGAPLRTGRGVLARSTPSCPSCRSAPGRSGTSRTSPSTGRAARTRPSTRRCCARWARASRPSTPARG